MRYVKTAILFCTFVFCASCRTKQRVLEERTDSLSVVTLRHQDSLHADFTFTFDSLTYILLDDSAKRPKGIVKVSKGRCELRAESGELREEERMEHKVDTTFVATEEHTNRVFNPPRLSPVIVLFIFFAIIIITYWLYDKSTS